MNFRLSPRFSPDYVGLKWSANDFTENTLTVRHTVHSTEEGIVAKGRLKTKSSYRTMTPEPFVRGELLKHREKQEQMKKVMRSAYSKEYTDYVCVEPSENSTIPTSSPDTSDSC